MSAARALLRVSSRPAIRLPRSIAFTRTFESTPVTPAVPGPITAQGPPPAAPLPAGSPIAQYRANQKHAFATKKRFWKEVHVVETADGYQIHLDTRLLKTPEKRPLLIPLSKPLLAHAIAIEWSNLRSASDATRSHRTPLTMMSSRAIDMSFSESSGHLTSRSDSIQNLIRYLSTDTVLCYAPTTPEYLREADRPMLRDLQISSARPILDFLCSKVWPGLEIWAVDGDEVGIVGRGQPVETKETLMAWMRGLDVWRFVGFERCVQATKSFVIGARMVEEWKEGGEQIWGVEEAAKAASIEVEYQTRQWGEVEDTHDVEKEDVRRQLGAGWLFCADTK
ncbi:hypothetical protein BZA77DRAFT_256689 [Pyronema omphalodes]|nr:hypothetical protein BZA77DRAFT_256689 [Pyronema omphalodes]